MLEASALVSDIANAFGVVPFPIHRGLHAAMAMDDWIEDEALLREITRTKDFIGEWWEVPADELQRCMLAHSYLDDHGVEFYLPAYMTALLKHPSVFDSENRISSRQVISFMYCHKEDPDEDPDELRSLFLTKFARIVGGKKRACRNFLSFMAESTRYNESTNEFAKEVLAQKFWASGG